jgi:hypothetical protein
MSSGHQLTGVASRSGIERRNSTVHLFGNELLKSCHQCCAPPAGGEDSQSVLNLQRCDRSGPDRGAWLLIKPFHNAQLTRGSHQLRQDIRVEDDHLSNRGGLIVWPRSSGISPSNSKSRNSDRRSQSAAIRSSLVNRVAQDVADFFFHASAMAFSAPLQSGLDAIFDVTNHELCHDSTPAYRAVLNDITISKKEGFISPVPARKSPASPNRASIVATHPAQSPSRPASTAATADRCGEYLRSVRFCDH